MKNAKFGFMFLLVLVLTQACSKSNGGASTNIPKLTPPVQAAAPGVFGGTGTLAFAMTGPSTFLKSLEEEYSQISASDFDTRFFQSGPTDIYSILQAIDSRTAGINGQSSKSSCLTQAPVAYTINPLGQAVTMYGQCYQSVTAGSASNQFVQWGVNNGVTYLWVQVGAGDLAAIVTPISATTTSSVQAWATVGNAGSNNTNGTTSANWATIGSYGVMQLTANPSTHKFEMVAAGTGLGYCGIHFASDGIDVYGEGSIDSGSSCDTSTPVCVSSANGTVVSGGCTVSATNFALTSIGRMAATSGGTSFAASAYPATPNVTLDGTSSDSLAFGPTTPTAGVGQF